MVILDTDHVSLFVEENEPLALASLRRRLSVLPQDQIASTIVTYEEQSRGWLGYVGRAKTVKEQVAAYRRLERHLENYKSIPLFGFTEIAAVEFQRLRKLGVRIGTMDLRISAIALTIGATILSRNLRDFEKVPSALSHF